MCIPGLSALVPALGAGGATAAGATAAAGAGAGLQTLGLLASVGGTLFSAVQQAGAARENVRLIEEQKQTEARINATEDHRSRLKMLRQIRAQTAELAARGVRLDSPTAVTLGQSAAQELSFDSQSVRSTGQARQQELTGQQRMLRARGRSALVKGGFAAAGAVLNKAPDIWPELLR